MSLRMTMLKIRTGAKRVFDLYADDSLDDQDEWNLFIDLTYGELWPEVSLGAERRYFETSTTITADGSTSYDEPASHFGTVRIARLDESGLELYDLRELRPSEEFPYKGTTGDAVAYALVDDQLYLYPAPSDGTYKWYFTQQPTDISEYADGDVVDVVVPAGKAFMIYGTAALALLHHRQDASAAMQLKEQARQRVLWEAINRNTTSTPTRGPVVDDDERVYGADGWPIIR